MNADISKKAIGYIRVSTTEQANSNLSLEAQRGKIHQYASLHDIELLDVISDEGVSAKNINRPGFKSLMKVVRGKKVGAVIVYKMDRLFRNTKDAWNISDEFSKKGVSPIFIKENIDTSSPQGKFYFTMMNAFAEMERDLIAERTLEALEQKTRNMELRSGMVPYGYDKFEKGTKQDSRGKIVPVWGLKPNPKEQKRIDKMKALRDKGLSYAKVANEMNRLGYPTKFDRKWLPIKIKKVLDRDIKYQEIMARE